MRAKEKSGVDAALPSPTEPRPGGVNVLVMIKLSCYDVTPGTVRATHPYQVW